MLKERLISTELEGEGRPGSVEYSVGASVNSPASRCESAPLFLSRELWCCCGEWRGAASLCFTFSSRLPI